MVRESDHQVDSVEGAAFDYLWLKMRESESETGRVRERERESWRRDSVRME